LSIEPTQQWLLPVSGLIFFGYCHFIEFGSVSYAMTSLGLVQSKQKPQVFETQKNGRATIPFIEKKKP